MTGGIDSISVQTKTQIYSVAKNCWQTGPDLVQARFSHSSCCLGDKIYVFGGNQPIGKFLNTIEILNANSLITSVATVLDENSKWTLICP